MQSKMDVYLSIGMVNKMSKGYSCLWLQRLQATRSRRSIEACSKILTSWSRQAWGCMELWTLSSPPSCRIWYLTLYNDREGGCVHSVTGWEIIIPNTSTSQLWTWQDIPSNLTSYEVYIKFTIAIAVKGITKKVFSIIVFRKSTKKVL